MRDLTAWLAQIGLEKYAAAFVAHEVDLAALPHLTDNDLKAIGLPLGARRKVLIALAAFGARPEGTTKPNAERRPVCVLFADLVGYTKLSQELDAEDLHRALQRFFGCVDHIVQQHGGRVDKHIGDCVMAVFGAPVAHGNDVERAVAAALAMRDAVPDLEVAPAPPLAVHIGVASGQVVASGLGSSYHREYTVTGEAVNLAARLTDAAGPGEVLVSNRVRRDLAERLDGTDAGLLEVVRFREPVRARRAQRLRSVTPRRALVGRNSELAQFHSILDTCRQTGRGRALHLRGEAGIGKTRLLEEVLAIAARQGFACHLGLVHSFGSGTGRDAVQALVRSLLGLDSAADVGRLEEGATAAAAAALADAENLVFLHDFLGLAPSGQLRVLYEAMDNVAREAGRAAISIQLGQRASRRQPRILAIEDLHWADAVTLDLLAPLAAAVDDCPALLIMTSRLEQDPLDQAWRAKAGDGPLLTIDVGPLHADASRRVGTIVPGRRCRPGPLLH